MVGRIARSGEVAVLLSLGVGEFGLPAQEPCFVAQPVFACSRGVKLVQQATVDVTKIVV
jgi:hypothetical protein